jgi:alginate O-acetyltransferase complex protein AlgI
MLFNSLEFLIFFLIVIPLYFALPHKFRWVLLLVSSCIFYMYFKPIYILILALTIVIDYYAGIWIDREKDKRRRKWLLVISLVSNIGILVIFKYFDFISNNLSALFSLGGGNVQLPTLKTIGESWSIGEIILPIGLSFHTFQAMSYTIEVYRGNQKPETHFGYYALYVMYFPQLVAGPIERPQNILHQLHQKQHFDYSRFIDGLQLMFWGLFKKMVIADRLSVFVDTVYNNPNSFYGLAPVLATVFFAFQIYCDFSGYSDVARGVSRIMGIELMVNFNRPYLSKSVGEFWRRWHISLSTWFRDYLYIPLGGNKVSNLIKMRNVLFVFGLSGLWHGANYTFIIWGLLNGLFIVIETMFNVDSSVKPLHKKGWLATYATQVLCFILICITWVFFRANNVQEAFAILKNSLQFKQGLSIGVPTVKTESMLMMFGVIGFLLMAERLHEYKTTLVNKVINWKHATIFAMAVSILLIGVFEKQNFIYFQF